MNETTLPAHQDSSAKAQKYPQVSRQLDGLDLNTSLLLQELEGLEIQLAGVLRSPEPRSADTTESEVLAPVAESLSLCSSRIYRAVETIRELRNRLEV